MIHTGQYRTKAKGRGTITSEAVNKTPRPRITKRKFDQLAEALEGFPLPAVSVDARGVTVWQNAAAREIFGEVGGTHYDVVVAPEERRATRERFAKLMLGKPNPRAKNVIRGTNGELLPVEVTSTPLREDGKVVGVLAIAVPLTSPYEPPARDLRVTPRQQDILRLLVRGQSTTKIAEGLHLSPATVRNYISALLRALGAGSRLEAVVIALRAGLVSLDETPGDRLI